MRCATDSLAICDVERRRHDTRCQIEDGLIVGDGHILDRYDGCCDRGYRDDCCLQNVDIAGRACRRRDPSHVNGRRQQREFECSQAR